MESRDVGIVFTYFKNRNFVGLRAIRHHLDKEEIKASTNQILTDIAQYLDDNSFDGKKRLMPQVYRDLLIEIANLVGSWPVLTMSQKGCVLNNDLELVRCLLNHLPAWQHEAVVKCLPGALVNSQFDVALMLIRYYLHFDVSGRIPDKKLTAIELYDCFESSCDALPFKSLGDDERAKYEIIELMIKSGYIHHILYMYSARRLVPRQHFFDSLSRISPADQDVIRLFHARHHAC